MLYLPDIPIAVANVDVLVRFGSVYEIPYVNRQNAVVLVERSKDKSVWVKKTYADYKKAWKKALDSGLVDP